MCLNKIRGDATNTWITQGRFSLYYNTSGKFSLVKISNLRKEDAGKYWCAMDVTLSHNIRVSIDEFTEAHLDVLEEGVFDYYALKYHGISNRSSVIPDQIFFYDIY